MKSSACLIDGSATFTTETSRITMNCARQARIRVAVRCVLLGLASLRGVMQSSPVVASGSASRPSSVRRSSNNNTSFDGCRTMLVTMTSRCSSVGDQTPWPSDCWVLSAASSGHGRALVARSGRIDELDLATVLHALSDPIRLRIVAQLADGGSTPAAASACRSRSPPAHTTSACCVRPGSSQQRIDGKCRFNRLRPNSSSSASPACLTPCCGPATRER